MNNLISFPNLKSFRASPTVRADRTTKYHEHSSTDNDDDDKKLKLKQALKAQSELRQLRDTTTSNQQAPIKKDDDNKSEGETSWQGIGNIKGKEGEDTDDLLDTKEEQQATNNERVGAYLNKTKAQTIGGIVTTDAMPPAEKVDLGYAIAKPQEISEAQPPKIAKTAMAYQESPEVLKKNTQEAEKYEEKRKKKEKDDDDKRSKY